MAARTSDMEESAAQYVQPGGDISMYHRLSPSGSNSGGAPSQDPAAGVSSPGEAQPFLGRDPDRASASTWGAESAPGSDMALAKYADDDQQGHEYARNDARAVPTAAAASKRKKLVWGGIALLLAVIVIAVAVGVTVGRRAAKTGTNRASTTETDGSSGSSAAPSASGSAAPAGAKLWGVGGDTITTENGTKFVYSNTLGGTWNAVPFNDTARAQGDQPSLNEAWDYSTKRIIGVNLGGWLVLEPFISPYMFEPFSNTANPAVDEWTLCQRLGSSMATTMEQHYQTFITEEDFAQIAAAGLNWIRLPVGWWMIETWGDEPFLEGVAFKYFLKAIEWARKYGLRINLDLHAVPGSQNGYNHSGKLGSINFLMGAMGVANAQRTLNYIRTLTQFISQPQYKNVVPMFSVLNEARLQDIGGDQLRRWYFQVYETMREITGTGQGNGPFMVIHDGFGGTGGGQTGWGGFLNGADRVGLDTHPYLCFGAQNTDSMAFNSAKPCSRWAPLYNQTRQSFGVSMGAEYSLAVNDCGLWVTNVNYGTRFDGTYPTPDNRDSSFPRMGSCDQWTDSTNWSAEMKSGFADLAQAHQDALGHSFFWTWTIGHSIRQSHPPNPMWNYKLGLAQGYIRPDARRSNGVCPRLAAAQNVQYSTAAFATHSAWQTGGAGAGNIAAAQTASFGSFPPPVISGAAASGTYNGLSLPRYTQTGTRVVTLSPTAPAASLYPAGAATTNPGNGWFQPEDKAPWWTPVAGCNYLDAWSGFESAAPTACGVGGGGSRRERRGERAAMPAATAPPSRRAL